MSGNDSRNEEKRGKGKKMTKEWFDGGDNCGDEEVIEPTKASSSGALKRRM